MFFDAGLFTMTIAIAIGYWPLATDSSMIELSS